MHKSEDVYEEWDSTETESRNPWINSYLAKERLTTTLKTIGYKANIPARLAEKPFFVGVKRFKREQPLFFYGLLAAALGLLISGIAFLFSRRSR